MLESEQHFIAPATTTQREAVARVAELERQLADQTALFEKRYNMVCSDRALLLNIIEAGGVVPRNYKPALSTRLLAIKEAVARAHVRVALGISILDVSRPLAPAGDEASQG